MSDWRKAWYTYGQCDASVTPENHDIIANKNMKEGVEDDGGGGKFVVNPFTGEANYEITEVDGTLPEDLVGVLYRNGEPSCWRYRARIIIDY